MNKLLLIPVLLLVCAVNASAQAQTYINVRWAPGVTDEVRTELERTYGLVLHEAREQRTFVYRLTDTSEQNIRAIVADARVEDTHGIDRGRGRIGRRDSTFLRGVIGSRVPRLVGFVDRYAEDLLTWSRIVLTVSGAAFLASLVSAARRRDVPWFARRLPPLSAGGLGLFRLAFGVGLIVVAITAAGVPPGLPHDLHRMPGGLADAQWVRALAAHPHAVTWIRTALLACLGLFTVGLLTRAAFAAATVLVTINVLVLLQHRSAHDWGVPVVTLWLLLLVPWSAGTSVDRWLRERAGRPVPSSRVPYGLALWIPGLTIGAALLAAAYAKLDTSGLAWITSGAVRYHFIEDARQASSSLGLSLARSDAFAVAASLAAVVVEATFWVVLLVRRPAARLAFGLAGAALLTGFYVFQGIWWPAWWVLLLAFVPWEPLAAFLDRVDTRATQEPRTARLEPRLAWIFTLVVVAQFGASAARIESEPFVSDFGMYSHTWPSRDAFNAYIGAKTREYEYSTTRLSEEDLERRLRELPKAYETLEEHLDSAIAGQPPTDRRRQAIHAVASEYERRYGEPLGAVRVRAIERRYDWSTGRLEPAPGSAQRLLIDTSTGAVEITGTQRR